MRDEGRGCAHSSALPLELNLLLFCEVHGRLKRSKLPSVTKTTRIDIFLNGQS